MTILIIERDGGEIPEVWYPNPEALRLTMRRKTMAGKGLDKELKCSAELREFTGKKKISRKDLTKLIWKHIKKRELQIEGNGRVFRVDSKMAPLIDKKLIAKKRAVKMRGKKIDVPAGHLFMTEVAGQMSKHLEA